MRNVAKLFVLFALLGAVGCIKNEAQNTGPGTSSVSDYMNLKPGNYWIYREFLMTDTGETDELITDTLHVQKDTLIRGKTFHKLIKQSRWYLNTQILLLRDSLDFMIDHTGRIHFSSNDYTSLFFSGWSMFGSDTIAKVTSKMTDKDFAVTTPAGVFITSSFTTSYAIFKKFNPNEPVSHWYTRYAKGVGMVTEVMASPANDPSTVWERRLVKWHVK